MTNKVYVPRAIDHSLTVVFRNGHPSNENVETPGAELLGGEVPEKR